MDHKGDGDTSCNWCTWNGYQSFKNGAGRVENQGTNRDHSNYSIIEIGQNTEKTSGNLRRHAVTQTPVKKLQWEKLAKIIIIIMIIRECRNLEQNEYKTRHNWVGVVIHWELCKNLKFDHTNKWYIHNPESILENETNKLHGILSYKQITSSLPDVQI